jgi:surfeit locus 1 family protein
MRVRMILPLLFGIGGVAVLLWLGVWQLGRLDEKETVLAEVARRMAVEPQDVPVLPDRGAHNYLQVLALGDLIGDEAHVLTSEEFVGPGFLVISKLVLGDGRAVLVDLGFVPEARKTEERPQGAVEVVGNMLWPNEVDSAFTPAPDLGKNIWFARDLPAMAAHLGAEPIMIVASAVRPAPANMPKPIRVASNIANDHLEYAITWFSLALVWMGMTLYLLWRIRQRTV